MAVGDRVVFTANSGTSAGNQVYISDGTAAGTTTLLSVAANSQVIAVSGNTVWIIANDGTHGSQLYTKTISNPDTNPPVAAAQTYTTYENLGFNTSANLGLLQGATDANGDSNLSIRIVAPPTNGTLTANADGTFGYTPILIRRHGYLYLSS